MHSRNIVDWILAFFNVFVVWSFGSIASSYSSQVLGINPIVYVCVIFLSCSACLLLITGPGKKSLNVLRNTQTWGYGASLILSFIVSFGLFSQVTPVEGELLQMFTVIVSVALGWLLFNRVPNFLQVIGLLFILAGIFIVGYYQEISKVAIIVFLVLLLSLFQALRSFSAEKHYHFNYVMKYSKTPIKDQLRVIGFIMFCVSAIFLSVVVPLAWLQSYSGQVIHPVIPVLDDFLYFEGIVVAILVGALIIMPARFLEFNSLNKLKTENYLAIGAIGPFATMFWQSATQGFTGLDLSSFLITDVYAAILISIGGLIIVLSKVLFKAKKQDILNEYIEYIDSGSMASFNILNKTYKFYDNDVQKTSDLLNIPAIVIEDILENKTALKQKYLKTLSIIYRNKVVTKDLLTKMNNRIALEDAFEKLNHSPKNYAIIYMDLNRFKYINDTFGHDAGDDALKVVASRLLRLSNKYISFYRLGGDEFVGIIRYKELKNLESLVQTINVDITHPFEIEKFNAYVDVGVSMGVVCKQDYKGKTAKDLLSIADKIMYKNKSSV